MTEEELLGGFLGLVPDEEERQSIMRPKPAFKNILVEVATEAVKKGMGI